MLRCRRYCLEWKREALRGAAGFQKLAERRLHSVDAAAAEDCAQALTYVRGNKRASDTKRVARERFGLGLADRDAVTSIHASLYARERGFVERRRIVEDSLVRQRTKTCVEMIEPFFDQIERYAVNGKCIG